MRAIHFLGLTALFALCALAFAWYKGNELQNLKEELGERVTATEANVPAIEVPALGVDDTETEAASGPDSNIPNTPNPQVEFVPVRYGLDGPEMDACGSYGEVTGLNPEGDNYLSVRASPFVGGHELDRLEPGQGVFMCDYKDGWVGIVYDKAGNTDCGTGSPNSEVRDYEKPCSSGWVSEDFVTLIAG